MDSTQKPAKRFRVHTLEWYGEADDNLSLTVVNPVKKYLLCDEWGVVWHGGKQTWHSHTMMERYLKEYVQDDEASAWAQMPSEEAYKILPPDAELVKIAINWRENRDDDPRSLAVTPLMAQFSQQEIDSGKSIISITGIDRMTVYVSLADVKSIRFIPL